MTIAANRPRLAAAFAFALAALSAAGCSRAESGIAVSPPETAPLSRAHVGYAVVSVMYARLGAEARADSAASGHARMGDVARVLERRLTPREGGAESWLLLEGESRGWIPEGMVVVYDNEAQARAAAGPSR